MSTLDQLTARAAHRVDSHVWISGYKIAADPEFIRANGITRIVKMFADDPSYPGGWHRHPGVKYAVFNTEDRESYDIRKDALAALRFAREGVAAGEQVLVHCHAGISRSATVVLLHLMFQGMPIHVAYRHLTRIRNVVNPNPGFQKYLLRVQGRINDHHATKPATSRYAALSPL